LPIRISRRSTRFFNIDKNPANPASAPFPSNARESPAIGQHVARPCTICQLDVLCVASPPCTLGREQTSADAR
jgi:hypothetical protein